MDDQTNRWQCKKCGGRAIKIDTAGNEVCADCETVICYASNSDDDAYRDYKKAIDELNRKSWGDDQVTPRPSFIERLRRYIPALSFIGITFLVILIVSTVMVYYFKRADNRRAARPAAAEDPGIRVDAADADVDTKMFSIPVIERTDCYVDDPFVDKIAGTVYMQNETDPTHYGLHIDESGSYHMAVSGVDDDAQIKVQILDEAGSAIYTKAYLVNGDVIPLGVLDAGRDLTVEVYLCIEQTHFELKLYKGVDVSGYTQISGKLMTDANYIDFYYTIPRTGRYRVEITSDDPSRLYDLSVYDSNDHREEWSSGCESGEGITLYNLIEGSVYKIRVETFNSQSAGHGTVYGRYTLNIWPQKEIIDVAVNNCVVDSVEYTDQRNVYMFAPESDSEIRLTYQEKYTDCHADLCVYDENDLSQSIAYKIGIGNDEDLSFTAKQGHLYQIQVRHNTGYSDYGLWIRNE
ncbi:MAG: hypothetical protein K6G22_11195 [Lachnospiraceae bacterium]|nr:hypothetical protein [Lachnospiraceae bacterium]